MSKTSYIIPVSRTSNMAIRRLRTAGQLRRTDEFIPGGGIGTVYRLGAELSATVAAASDFRLQVGRELLDVDVYRTPEWEYSLLIRASPSFTQRRLAHLIPALLAAPANFDAPTWAAQLVTALQTPVVVGPVPLTVSETWSPAGQFLAAEVRLIDRNGLWSVHLPFEVPHTRDLTGEGAVLGVDIGLRPLLTVAVATGGTWSTGSVNQLSPGEQRLLLSLAAAAGVARRDVLQAQRLLVYAAARQLIEEGFLVPVVQEAGTVIFERLRYEGMHQGVAQASRDLAVRDCVTAWLPQLARIHGIRLILVPPAYTSVDCSRCDLRHERQRVTFQCRNPRCRFTAGVHENAARNILKRAGVSLF